MSSTTPLMLWYFARESIVVWIWLQQCHRRCGDGCDDRHNIMPNSWSAPFWIITKSRLVTHAMAFPPICQATIINKTDSLQCKTFGKESVSPAAFCVIWVNDKMQFGIYSTRHANILKSALDVQHSHDDSSQSVNCLRCRSYITIIYGWVKLQRNRLFLHFVGKATGKRKSLTGLQALFTLQNGMR